MIDSRSIEVFKDHLARDYANFGTGRSCGGENGEKWKPKALYGLKDSNVPLIKTWNCFGSVKHAYNNSGNGYSLYFNDMGKSLHASYIKNKDDIFSSSTLGTLQRGDIIYYENITDPVWPERLHAQTVSSGTETYSANNEPPQTTATWKWAKSKAGEWANGFYKNRKVKIEVYR